MVFSVNLESEVLVVIVQWLTCLPPTQVGRSKLLCDVEFLPPKVRVRLGPGKNRSRSTSRSAGFQSSLTPPGVF